MTGSRLHPSRKLPLTLTAVFCTLLWGSAAPFIKWGYDLFGITRTGDILVFAGIRFLLAGLLVILAGSLMEHRFLAPEKKAWDQSLYWLFFRPSGSIFCIIWVCQKPAVSAVR
ncbi:hypothetical protein [uncultured Faecalibaculum sp.]|uniref:hypothetical protein n=1 Tax=uncultured Faecalibaculum sp. TaxID=1729681 RepID=UPI002632C20A|nr:hypothetical protein [uncultured Faecalibaculum sp.]